MTRKNLKRVLVMADTHCGSLFGLTPPQYELQPDPDSPKYPIYKQRTELWRWWRAETKALGHIDRVLAVGDLIEGKGMRNSGADNLNSSQIDQKRMASNLLRIIKADEYQLVRGTPYHVGNEGDDFEDAIGDDLGDADVQDKVYLSYCNHTLYARHKIGKSGALAGWGTAPAKELTWLIFNTITSAYPEMDIGFAAHIHEHTIVSKYGKTFVTLPALQLPGTSYGARQCTGNYDVGFCVLDFIKIGDAWEPKLQAHLYPAQAYAPLLKEW